MSQLLDAVQISEVLRNYALLAAALGGVGVAIWRAIAADRQSKAQSQQVMQSRREHVAKIFSSSVELLDNEKLHVRLGAIFALREVVEAYPELSRPTVDLLTAYLTTVDYGDDDPPADVAEIMSVVIPQNRPQSSDGEAQ